MTDTLKVLSENYLDNDLLLSSDKSSQASSTFSYLFVLEGYRRAKKWRSAGYWLIESGSNTIIFQETGGINLTATIAAGAYTSDSDFFTAIKAALDAAGDSTYTVTRDTTSLGINLASTRTGGTGIFHIIWSHASSAAMAAILGFSTAANDTGASNYTADSLKIHTSEWIKFDLGTSSNPSACVLLGDRNESLGISASATVTLQGNHTDSWTSPAFSQALEYSEKGMVAFSESGFGAYRYWRIQIVDTANPAGYVEINKLYLGEAFTPTRGRPQFPLTITPVDRSSVTVSRGGCTWSDRRQKTSNIGITWYGLTNDEREDLETIWEDKGNTDPFFLVLDPNAVFSSSAASSARLVKFASEPRFTLESPANWRCEMLVREEL